MNNRVDWEKSVTVRNGGPTSRFMQRRTGMAYPVPTKAYLQPSPEAAMASCLHPLRTPTHFPLSHPFWWCRTSKFQGHCRKWYHEHKICWLQL